MWTPQTNSPRAFTASKVAPAKALETLGRDFGQDAALEEAITLFRDTVIPLAPRDERPNDEVALLVEQGALLTGDLKHGGAP